MRFVKEILSISIISTALIGDYMVFKSNFSESQLFRAVSDSLVHASIGLLSSLLFFAQEISTSNYAVVCNVLFCTFLSSFIDVDHAIAARSVLLKDMLNLRQRGIFHCTTAWILLSGLLLLYSIIARKLNVLLLTVMIVIAYTSHHIRDGNRRGLWLYPFGSTPPIPKYAYMLLLVFLPYLYSTAYKVIELKLYKAGIVAVDYKNVV